MQISRPAAARLGQDQLTQTARCWGQDRQPSASREIFRTAAAVSARGLLFQPEDTYWVGQKALCISQSTLGVKLQRSKNCADDVRGSHRLSVNALKFERNFGQFLHKPLGKLWKKSERFVKSRGCKNGHYLIFFLIKSNFSQILLENEVESMSSKKSSKLSWNFMSFKSTIFPFHTFILFSSERLFS